MTPTSTDLISDANDDWIQSADIAKALGVSPSAVSNWKKRHSDFPQPLFRVGPHKIYSREEVLAWGESRKQKRGHGGERVPTLETMLRLAGRMSAKDRQALKEAL